MARPRISTKMVSYGIYENWDKSTKNLPDIKKFSTTVPAELDIEFGYILNIKKARGKKLAFKIDHPSILDSTGTIMPPFEGDVYVKSNDWHFFLGDTLWEPVSEKRGIWRLTTWLDGTIIADKSFDIT